MERPLLGEPAGDTQAIHALHPMKAFGNRAGLVGLDAADEVPLQVEVSELVSGQRSLEDVFIELTGSEGGL